MSLWRGPLESTTVCSKHFLVRVTGILQPIFHTLSHILLEECNSLFNSLTTSLLSLLDLEEGWLVVAGLCCHLLILIKIREPNRRCLLYPSGSTEATQSWSVWHVEWFVRIQVTCQSFKVHGNLGYSMGARLEDGVYACGKRCLR